MWSVRLPADRFRITDNRRESGDCREALEDQKLPAGRDGHSIIERAIATSLGLVLVERTQCPLLELNGLPTPLLEVLELDGEFVAGGAVDVGGLVEVARRKSGLVSRHKEVTVLWLLGRHAFTPQARTTPDTDELLPVETLPRRGDDDGVVPRLAHAGRSFVDAASRRDLMLLGELDHPTENALRPWWRTGGQWAGSGAPVAARIRLGNPRLGGAGRGAGGTRGCVRQSAVPRRSGARTGGKE